MKKTEFCNPSTMFPLNLQFFADEGDGASAESSTNPEPDAGTESTKDTASKDDAVDYSAKYAESEARAKKLKADLDNALKKLGDLNKQYRAKMTEDELKAEQDAAAKEEHEAYVKELEIFKRTTEAKNRYLMQGMKDDVAARAAKAEIEGDMDELAAIQATHTKELLKAKEQEWKASRPRVNTSDGEESSMTKDEIFAIKDAKARQEAIARNLSLF